MRSSAVADYQTFISTHSPADRSAGQEAQVDVQAVAETWLHYLIVIEREAPSEVVMTTSPQVLNVSDGGQRELALKRATGDQLGARRS